MSSHGIAVDLHTGATSVAGIFAGGDATRRASRLAIRAVADGKAVAASIHQYLTGQPVTGPQTPLAVHIGKLDADELKQFVQTCPAPSTPRQSPPLAVSDSPLAVSSSPIHERPGFSPDQARAESARCLRCDCRGRDKCLLRIHAQAAAAKPARFKAQRRRFIQDLSHELVIYESGKCIACGLCVQIAQKAAEKLGLTFIGRGFNVRLAVPFGQPIGQGLQHAAAQCAAACPTGAIVLRQQ
jgi:ferredoxin